MMRATSGRAILVLALWLTASSGAAAQQKTIGAFGDWTAVADGTGAKRICYVGSMPKKAEGKYKQRDDAHVLVTHRPAEKVTGEVSVTAGYTYRNGSTVDVDIGGKTFKLFSRNENGWAYDAAADKAIVAAMKAGSKMTVRGTSSRGTVTTDTYSLAGFSAAYHVIGKACAAK